MTPMHPNDAIAYIGNNAKPEWSIVNFKDELIGQPECWKLFISSPDDSRWHQVLNHPAPFLQLDWVIKAMYENGLPVSSMPITIGWD